MGNFEVSKIIEKINQFEEEVHSLRPEVAEGKIFEILKPLLVSDGYTLEYVSDGDKGIDYIAKKKVSPNIPTLTTGIEYKYSGKDHHVSRDSVERLLKKALIREMDRILLLSVNGFSNAARAIVTKGVPTNIELLDLNLLRIWAYRLERNLEKKDSPVVQGIILLSKNFARIVANNPKELDNLEWRDMERMLAEVFEGLGFKVELTPGSKDGGKDIILECSVSNENKTYIVEVKHWRSGQHVGKKFISDFVNVIAREKRVGGLYLATYGYCEDAFEALTEVGHDVVIGLGAEKKIVSLCKSFVKAESCLWSLPDNLPGLLFDDIIEG